MLVITLLLISIFSNVFNTVIADSPFTNRQEIENSNIVWDQIALPNQTAMDIHDGRKIFFNTASNLTQCKESGNNALVGKLPNLTSVSYISDGKVLNTTFWLSRSALINDHWQSPLRSGDIHQVSLHISIADTKEKILSNESVINERNYLTRKYRDIQDVSIINESRSTNLDNYKTAKLFLTGKLNYSSLGHPNINATDTFTIVDGKLYRILYLAEPSIFSDYLPVVDKIINSFQSRTGSNIKTENKDIDTDTDNKFHTTTPNRYTGNREQGFITYANEQIKIDYPSTWEKIEKQNSALILFSPIKGPYLIGTGYTTYSDVPSVYNSPTDFVAKAVWWDGHFNETWF